MKQYTAYNPDEQGFSYKSLFIPIVLLQHSVTENRKSETQLYITLKLLCEGQTRLSGTDLYIIADLIGVSKRTVRRKLKELMKWNWVGHDKNSGFYFIRGFKKVCEIEELKGSICAEFNPKWIKDFNAFIGGAIIGHLVKQQIRRDNRLDCNSGRSEHGRSSPASHFKPVATNALCKIFDISYGVAYRMKQDGHKFLQKDDTRKKSKCLCDDSRQLPEFLRSNPEYSGKIFVKNDKIWTYSTDYFKPELFMKSCRRYRAVA